jgi:hypothetical protein
MEAKLIALLIYKISSLFTGLISLLLGYKLFSKGICQNEGGLEAQYGESKIVLTSIGPGIFFALFGSIIIGVTLFKGMDLSETKRQNMDASGQKIVANIQEFAVVGNAAPTKSTKESNTSELKN